MHGRPEIVLFQNIYLASPLKTLHNNCANIHHWGPGPLMELLGDEKTLSIPC